jgi:hypothetical protein
MKMAGWRIVVEPEGKNPGAPPPPVEGAEQTDEIPQGTNEGGMIVYLADDGGHSKREVSRVAWVRRNGANPDVAFHEQLRAEVDKAKQAIDLINELTAGAGQLQ